ncbi:hypothetical protein ACJX0J_037608, partial [Zea mays]
FIIKKKRELSVFCSNNKYPMLILWLMTGFQTDCEINNNSLEIWKQKKLGIQGDKEINEIVTTFYKKTFWLAGNFSHLYGSA